MRCRHACLLTNLILIPNEHYEEANRGNSGQVQAFLKTEPEVSRILGEAVGTLDDGAYQFELLNETILQYLEEGIVPSTLNVRQRDATEVGITPSAVTLLNSGMNFYLERVPALMKRIKDENIDSTERRVFWVRKVEGWIAKALEDVRLKKRVENVGIDSL